MLGWRPRADAGVASLADIAGGVTVGIASLVDARAASLADAGVASLAGSVVIILMCWTIPVGVAYDGMTFPKKRDVGVIRFSVTLCAVIVRRTVLFVRHQMLGAMICL